MLKRLGPFYESHRATLTVVVVAHFAPPRRSVGPSSRIAGSFLLIWALTACAHASPRSTRFGSAYSSAASITAYEVPTREAHRSDEARSATSRRCSPHQPTTPIVRHTPTRTPQTKVRRRSWSVTAPKSPDSVAGTGQAPRRATWR